MREIDLYSNRLANIKYKEDLKEKFQSLKKISLSKNDLNILDVFKAMFMFHFVEELNTDDNLICLPDET